jgi:hypothetical protein
MKKIIALSVLAILTGSIVSSSAYAMNPFEKRQIIQHKIYEKNRWMAHRDWNNRRFIENRRAYEFAHRHDRNNHPWR